jgi:hypothetical protein
MLVFAFNYPVLLGSFNAGFLVDNSLGKEKGIESGEF